MRPACALHYRAPAAYHAQDGRIPPAADLEVSCSPLGSRARRTVAEVVRSARCARRGGGAILAPPAFADRGLGQYVQRNLVSDIPGAAELTDSSLINAWGCRSAPRRRRGSPTTAPTS